MRLGIIGLPSSGKTTLFNALTRSNLPTGDMVGDRIEMHTAAIDVPDERLTKVSQVFQPKKTTFTKVSYADIGGLTIGGDGLPGQLVNHLEQMDGLLLVVRAFHDPAIPHPLDSIDPKRDADRVLAEFILHDMITTERRLDKLSEDRAKGGRDKADINREDALFKRMMKHLEGDHHLREVGLTPDEVAQLQGFGLMTLLPILVVTNSSGDSETDDSVMDSIPATTIWVRGKLEMEIAQLSSEDEQIFLEEYGLTGPGRERIIQASYEALDLLTFFTGNDEEARAWTLPQGGTAMAAAECIHSDMARGFIRAEVISWEELVELGSLTEARSQGKLRVEGKDYIVADGEVIYIRFNI